MLGTIQQADICSSEKESYTNIFFSIEEKETTKKMPKENLTQNRPVLKLFNLEHTYN